MNRSVWVLAACCVVLTGCATPLMRAARDGRTEQAAALIGQGADVNAFVRWDVYHYPLISAAANGQAETVKLLLDKGADVAACGGLGSALHEAAAAGHAEVVSILLAHGANPNQTQRFCNSAPLMYAAQQGHAEVVGLLLKAGADAKITTTNECDAALLIGKIPVDHTALMLAEENGHDDIVRMLRVAHPNSREGTELPGALQYMMGVAAGALKATEATEKAIQKLK